MSALETGVPGRPAIVYVTRFGTAQRERASLGALLEPGDLLEGDSAGAAAEVTCPRSASLNFSGAFRAVIIDPQDRDCAVNLLSGSLDVLTSDSTQAQAGDITMGSLRTMYALYFVNRGDRAVPQAEVYDGDVDVVAQGRKYVLTSGLKLSAANVEPVRMRPAEFERPSTMWARLDLARAQASGTPVRDPQETFTRLRATYATVLANPDDAGARIDLAGQQVALASPRLALLHLDRAEKQRLAQPQAALAQYTKYAAFERLGENERAAQSYQRAVRLDPAIAQKAAQLPVPSGRLQSLGPLTVRVSVSAPDVARGALTRIAVQALSPGNTPVSGATITITAGGGRFRESGRTEVTGQTDANGQFSASWSCAPCAPAYVLGIKATHPRFEPTSAETRVGIR